MDSTNADSAIWERNARVWRITEEEKAQVIKKCCQTDVSYTRESKEKDEENVTNETWNQGIWDPHSRCILLMIPLPRGWKVRSSESEVRNLQMMKSERWRAISLPLSSSCLPFLFSCCMLVNTSRVALIINSKSRDGRATEEERGERQIVYWQHVLLLPCYKTSLMTKGVKLMPDEEKQQENNTQSTKHRREKGWRHIIDAL